MYPAPFRYHRPATLPEAISVLSELGDTARLLSGGQTLIPMLKLRLDEPTDLVDIGRLPDLQFIDRGDGRIRIGALATHGQIAKSEVAAAVPIVGDCAGGIADPQVRARGTIAGGLCAADPNSDWPTLLQTLDARVVCNGPDGERSLPAREFIVDAYTTALQRGELVTAVAFDEPPTNSGGAYVAFKRAAPAYPIVSVGVQLTMEDDNTCRNVSVVLGGAGPVPLTAEAAQNLLHGEVLSPETLRRAADAVFEAAQPPSDVRGSAEHKKSTLRGLFLRAANTAMRRCGRESVNGGHQYV